MAKRAVWSGSLSFGLVNVPVKMVGAISPKEVRFHLMHDADGGRIHERRVCDKDGREVPLEHIVKGYELGKGRYVMLNRDELSAADMGANRQIDIEEFVRPNEIDPLFYQSSYYLVPDKGAGKAYALLVEALERTGKVALARVVLRNREYLCAIRPLQGGLSLSTLLHADEVEGMPKGAEPSGRPQERELRMAEALIESLSGPFRPEKYQDEHRRRLLAIVEKKAEGEEVVAPERKEVPKVAVNLMEALEASLEANRGAALAGQRRAGPLAARTVRHRTRPGRPSTRRARRR